MDPLVILVIVGVVAALSFAAHDASRTTEQAFTGYFRGVKPDPWPHGVQEEDRTARWGSVERAAVGQVTEARAQEDLLEPSAGVLTARVEGSVRRRSW